MSLCLDIADYQRAVNVGQSRVLWHMVNHPLRWRRRYRRGKNRCKVCGGYLESPR